MTIDVGALFAGQGSQYEDMIKSNFPDYARLLKKLLPRDDYFQKYNDIIQKNTQEIQKNGFSQEILFLFEEFQYFSFIEKCNKPCIIAGYSFGFFPALVNAGVLDIYQTLDLLHYREQLLNQFLATSHSTYNMAYIIGIEYPVLQKIIRQQFAGSSLCISIINSKNKHTISGTKNDVLQLLNYLDQNLLCKSIVLANKVPYHSQLLSEINEQFIKYLDQIKLSDAQIPVISHTDGSLLVDSGKIRQELNVQMTKTVNWQVVMHRLKTLRIAPLIEFGPKHVLTTIGLNDYHINTYSFDDAGLTPQFATIINSYTIDPQNNNPFLAELISCAAQKTLVPEDITALKDIYQTLQKNSDLTAITKQDLMSKALYIKGLSEAAISNSITRMKLLNKGGYAE